MDNSQETANGPQNLPWYLLTIRGELAPATLEDARQVHNSTAGAPQNVAAAQALGDLSHMVYVPAGWPGSEPGEFLILDVWNSMDGLGQFFANPTVQEQAGQIFSKRDPVVWAPAPGFLSYHLPAPYGQNERIVAVVRGTVRSIEDAREAHNAIVSGEVNKARRAGDISHEVYVRMASPDSPQALELFAVDMWISPAGMGEYYSQPGFMEGVQKMFAGPPATSVWVHPEGDWVEW